MENNSSTQDRIQGCLLGQAVGDALGTRYEFKSAKIVRNQMKTDISKATGDGKHLPILGQGPFDLVAGQVTDDTELALAMARSLVKKKTFDITDIAKSYAKWYHSHPFDIGSTTSNAFKNVLKSDIKKIAHEKMLKSSVTCNQGSLSNGCLMRISPLAIAGIKWKSEILRASAKLNCQLTNPNPITMDAVSVYVIGLQTALITGDPVKTFETAYDAAETQTVRDLLKVAIEDTNEGEWSVKLANGKSVTPDSSFMGYFGIALQGAFHELIHASSFEQAMINIISAGGDTDTNACIAGALLGAIFGYKQIPKDWSDQVINAKSSWRTQQYPDAQTSDLLELAIQLSETQEPSLEIE